MAVTRAKRQQRKTLARAVSGSLKQQIRGTRWRLSKGWLFRQSGDWFVEVRVAIWASAQKTTAEFRAKPMALDPVFWEIVRAPELVDQPLSFRLHGAWTCRCPVWSQTEIAEQNSTPDQIAEQILSWATRQINELPTRFGHTAFVDFLKGQPDPRASKDDWFACLVSALALDRRLQEVRALCEAAVEQGERVGYSFGELSFPELALAWLEQHPSGRITLGQIQRDPNR